MIISNAAIQPPGTVCPVCYGWGVIPIGTRGPKCPGRRKKPPLNSPARAAPCPLGCPRAAAEEAP